MSEAGEEIIKFRKAWERNEDGCLDALMADISSIDEGEPPVEIDEADGVVMPEETEV